MKRPVITRRRLLRWALILTGCWLLVWYALPFAVPLPDGLAGEPSASPVLLDRHGEVIDHLTLPDATRAAPVALAEMPADFIACTLAAEDKRFYSHGGVDLLAMTRAIRDGVFHRRITSGASTITQQLIKISAPPRPRGILTKCYEALAARHLEMTWSKDRILEAYLNRLDYGSLRHSPTEATRHYFQKPMADLSLAECALLAGLPQAPSRLNPIKHPAAALVRRDTVLRRLEAAGRCPSARIQTALGEPLNLRPLRETDPAPWLAGQAPRSNESRIATTLDLRLQRAIAAIVREETSKLKAANLRHAAVVVIHNPTGEILALVPSADWDDPRGGQFNGAFTPRSPGSTLKPFTYLLAMERNRLIPASIVSDIPSPFRTPQGLDLPENYDRTYRGPVTLRTALACSLNVPALRTLNELGGPEPLHALLAQLGVTAAGDDWAGYGLGLTLGNAPVRLLDLTNAYATLARQGRYLQPRLFSADAEAEPQQLLDPVHCWLISHILADPQARVPAFGSGSPLDLPFSCAVKTGTSSDYHDNWCLGFTPEFTVGVWAGNFESRPMKGISGVTGAAPIFNRTLCLIHTGHPPVPAPRPEDLVDITIDCRNGKLLPDDHFPGDPYARRDLAPRDRLPAAATVTDYDPAGKALLDSGYAAWFKSGHNLRRADLALDPAQPATELLRVITPANGTTYLLDPEIPSGSDRLRPVTNFPGTARWSSPSLRIEPGTPEPVIHLTPGTHVLTATDPRTGQTCTVTLHVRRL